MKRILVTIGVIFTLTVNAQNYFISFAGIGASSTVNSVKVENLMTGTTLTLNEGDILRLSGTTGINSPENKQASEIKIYPNPMTEESLMEVYPPVGGDAEIAVYDMTGRQLLQQRSYLEKSGQQFRLAGFRDGLYLISAKGNNYQISGQLLCRVNSGGTISIDKVSNNIQSLDNGKSEVDIKGTESTVDMLYSTGDRLKFTGISGIYSTVIMDVPTGSKTLTFTFIACTDGDANNYSIIQIGTQIWMAENLKTTKYNDGTAIPNITVAATWAAATTGAYSDYNNTPANSTIYGRLYNWYVVDNNAATKVASNGGKNVCPTSWHVPKDTEWTTLTTYLGGETDASGKLKETNTTHWLSPNTGATNETGFTALPGGIRAYYGTDFWIGDEGFWWSSTESSTSYAWGREMNHVDADVLRISNLNKQNGYSVRCLKDN
jgi:uncharacterized protein (TIGR02145 family)